MTSLHTSSRPLGRCFCCMLLSCAILISTPLLAQSDSKPNKPEAKKSTPSQNNTSKQPTASTDKNAKPTEKSDTKQSATPKDTDDKSSTNDSDKNDSKGESKAAKTADAAEAPPPPHEAAPAIMPVSRKWNPINLDPLIMPSPLPQIRYPWEEFKFKVLEDIRLRTNIFDTIFFQQASNVIGGGPHNQTYNRLDVGIIWEVFQHSPEIYPFIGNGWVEFLFRSGVNIDHNSRFFNLNTATGAISNPNSLFQDTNASLNILSYTQSFFKDEVLVTLGRIHPNQYIALLTVANDESLQFTNAAFDGGQVIPSIGTYSSGLAVQVLPTDWFSFHGVMINNIGDANTINITSLDQGDYGFMADLIFKPKIPKVGRGRWHGIIWQSKINDQSGVGFSFIVEQHIGHGIVPFFRYGFGDQAVSPARQQVAGGITVISPFNRIGDMLGVAAAWTDPSDDDFRQETNLEAFYRVQITNYMQFSPDFQVIFNPAENPEDDIIFLWGLRLRTQF
ncbi:carbohydrate porin [Planctomycetota bacterium]|nr:carbohydrate porin [Planctomycetota bacterium]